MIEINSKLVIFPPKQTMSKKLGFKRAITGMRINRPNVMDIQNEEVSTAEAEELINPAR